MSVQSEGTVELGFHVPIIFKTIHYSFWYGNLFLYCVRYFGTNTNGCECEMSVDECSFVVNLLYKADYSSVRSLILMTESGAFVKT